MPWRSGADAIVALVLAQATFIPSGISVRGGVTTPLALLPCTVLRSAIKFINLTVPSSAGRIGMNLRFLQRMGAPPAEALATSTTGSCVARTRGGFRKSSTAG